MAGRIAVIGSNNVDLVTNVPRMPGPGETLAGAHFATGFGGKGANQAVAAARLGSQVTMVTRVGEDSFGREVLQNLGSHGIDLAHAFVAQRVVGQFQLCRSTVYALTDAHSAKCRVYEE